MIAVTKNKKTPKLRFPGFKDDWEEKTLDSISKIGTGNKDTKDKVEGGKYPFFVRSDTTEWIDTYSYDGVAILTSGDGVGVGKNYHYVNGKFDFHQRVYAIREFSPDVDSRYVYEYFAEKFYSRVIRMSAKNSVDSVRMDMIAKMLIPLPEKKEQEKIAAFLWNIDNKIVSLQTKKELLEKYKKGVLQKIFSQQIRFKDEDGKDYPAWEERKLGDVFERITTKNNRNNTNVLTISAQQGLVSQIEYFNKSVAAKDLSGYYVLNKDDFAYNKSYSTGFPMGAIKRLKLYENGVVSMLYICFRAKKGENAAYFEHMFNAGIQNHGISKVAQEGARNHGLLNIAVNAFFEIKLPVPASYKEQEKIADFLTSIDEKIEAEERKLEQAKQFKKALLQQMFV